ncbi:SHOCT domain-containing protein [Ferruginivarius sediminum]|nr:SHOCT domain-containing protein [Ferruginivarius sediminum]
MQKLVAAMTAILATAMPAAAQQPGYYGRGWNDHMMGWWFPFGGILMFLAVAAVIVVAVLVIRYLWNVGHNHGAGQSGSAASRREALDILDTRYARGEIDREEYLRRKQDLQGG